MNRLDSSSKKNLAGTALFSFELVIVLTLFIMSLIIFSIVAYKIFHLKDEQFDHLVFEKVATLVNETTTSLMQFITFLGSTYFLILVNVILAIYFLFIRKHKWYSIKVPVIALGGVSLMVLMKQFFNRQRPLTPLLAPVEGLSFPSGHSFMSAVTFGLLIYLAWKNFSNPSRKWLFVFCLAILILLIGFSRIYLRLHYFSDVMAGFSAGIIWLSLSIFILSKIERYSSRNLDPVISEIDKNDS
jgi:membrane-associated phospholipid phosphatase